MGWNKTNDIVLECSSKNNNNIISTNFTHLVNDIVCIAHTH